MLMDRLEIRFYIDSRIEMTEQEEEQFADLISDLVTDTRIFVQDQISSNTDYVDFDGVVDVRFA